MNEAENQTPANKLELMAREPYQAMSQENVTMGFDSKQGFELMQRGATLLSKSTLVPKEYQDNLPNCVVALNMASRIRADPMMVMQNLYIVHNKPSWSAQFVIACFNQCGRFSAMKFRWANRPADPDSIPDNWACQAYATELATGDEISGPTITIKMAKKEGWYGKSGSKWQTIPELMLMYRAGAWLQRTHAPDISMGLRTAEEESDIIESRRTDQGTFVADAQAKTETRVIDKMDILANKEQATNKPPAANDVAEQAEDKPAEANDDDSKAPTMLELIKGIQAAKDVDHIAELLDLARGIKRQDWRDKVMEAGRIRLKEMLPNTEIGVGHRPAPVADAVGAGDSSLFGDD